VISEFLRAPLGVRIGAALSCCSAALYLFFALYWGFSTLTEDNVRPGDLALRGGGTGLILAVLASAGAAVGLFGAVAGPRLWYRDKALSAAALFVGAVIGILPVTMLLTPMSA